MECGIGWIQVITLAADWCGPLDLGPPLGDALGTDALVPLLQVKRIPTNMDYNQTYGALTNITYADLAGSYAHDIAAGKLRVKLGCRSGCRDLATE